MTQYPQRRPPRRVVRATARPRPRGVAWRFWLVGLLLVGAIAAFAPTAYGAVTREIPAFGGEIVEALVGQPATLNPLDLESPIERDIGALLFNGLARLGPTGELEPDLADFWTVEAGGAYLIRLRDGLRWHDGQPITSRDVAFTFQPESACDADQTRRAASGVEIETRGDLDLRLRLATPPAIAAALTRPIASVRQLAGESCRVAAVRPVGSGPFRIAQSSLDGVTLDRHPDYHRGRPYLDRYRLRLYPDDAAATAAWQRGEVGVWFSRHPVEAGSAAVARPVVNRDELLIVLFNPRRPPLGDAALRAELASAINAAAIAAGARGYVALAEHSAGEADVAAAGRRLDDLGWVVRPGGGRGRADVDLRWTVAAPTGDDNAAFAARVIAVVDRVAPGARALAAPWPELVERRLAAGDFDLALVSVANVAALDERAFAEFAATITGGEAGAAPIDADDARAWRRLRAADVAAVGVDDIKTLARAWSVAPIGWAGAVWLTPAGLGGVFPDVVPFPAARYHSVHTWHTQTARVWRWQP